MNILLVDDEPICISTVSHILNNMYDGEVTLYTAVSASEALDIVKKTKIDLVFTDIRMPNTDGLELIKSILRILPVCEVVILSAYDQKKYLKTAINLNVFRYLQKPINPTEILEVTQLVAAKHETLKTMSAPEKIDFMQRKIIDILISQSYHPQKIKMLSEHILDSDFFSCKYIEIFRNRYLRCAWIETPGNEVLAAAVAVNDIDCVGSGTYCTLNRCIGVCHQTFTRFFLAFPSVAMHLLPVIDTAYSLYIRHNKNFHIAIPPKEMFLWIVS